MKKFLKGEPMLDSIRFISIIFYISFIGHIGGTIYIAVLPELSQFFHVSSTFIKFSITIYFIGLSSREQSSLVFFLKLMDVSEPSLFFSSFLLEDVLFAFFHLIFHGFYWEEFCKAQVKPVDPSLLFLLSLIVIMDLSIVKLCLLFLLSSVWVQGFLPL
jgi:hypothetical protein